MVNDPMGDVDLSALLPYEPAYASCWLSDLPDADVDPPEFRWMHLSPEAKDATERLTAWLAGTDHRHRPRGSVLVTGLRGVGKTSLVNLALHRAAVRLRTRSHSNGPGKGGPAEALMVVWVDCPRVIEPAALLQRVLRRFYMTAVDHGLGGIAPGLVQQARTAYLRTLGSLKESLTEQWKRTVGFEMDKLTSMKLSWEDEYSLARTLELVAGQAGEVECEDEVARLTAAMGAPGFGHRAHVFGRALDSLQQRLTKTMDFIGGRRGASIRPVFVFDELDKVEDPAAVARTLEVLKTIFTSCPAAFIFIAGARQEAAWLRAESEVDSILTSVFAWRLYVPALTDRAALWDLIRCHWSAGPMPSLSVQDDVLEGLMLWSGGIPKNIVRLLRSQFEVVPNEAADGFVLCPTAAFGSRYLSGASAWKTLTGEVSAESTDLAPYCRDARRLHACARRWREGMAVDAGGEGLANVERLEVNEQGRLLPNPAKSPNPTKLL